MGKCLECGSDVAGDGVLCSTHGLQSSPGERHAPAPTFGTDDLGGYPGLGSAAGKYGWRDAAAPRDDASLDPSLAADTAWPPGKGAVASSLGGSAEGPRPPTGQAADPARDASWESTGGAAGRVPGGPSAGPTDHDSAGGRDR